MKSLKRVARMANLRSAALEMPVDDLDLVHGSLVCIGKAPHLGMRRAVRYLRSPETWSIKFPSFPAWCAYILSLVAQQPLQWAHGRRFDPVGPSRPTILRGLLVMMRSLRDAQIKEDLRADAVIAEVRLEAELSLASTVS